MNRFALVFGLVAPLLTPCVHAQTEQEPPYLTPGDEPGEVDVNWSSVTDRTYFLQVSLDLTRWLYLPHIEYGNGETLVMTFPEIAGGAIFYRLQYTDAAVPGSNPDNADFDGDGLSNNEEGVRPPIHVKTRHSRFARNKVVLGVLHRRFCVHRAS